MSMAAFVISFDRASRIVFVLGALFAFMLAAGRLTLGFVGQISI